MSLLNWAAGAIAFAGELAIPAAAGPQGSEQKLVSAWLQQEWDRARKPPERLECRLEVIIEQHWVPLPEALVEMEARVRDHPDHPDAAMLKIYRQRQMGEPTKVRRRMWIGADGWRLSEDLLSREFPPGSFQDTASDQQTAFFLQKGALSILSSALPGPPGKDIRTPYGMLTRSSQALLTGGMSITTVFGAQIDKIGEDGDQWVLETSVPAGVPQAGERWRVTGRWSRDELRGFPSECTLIAASPAGQGLSRSRATNWKFHSGPGLWAAGEVELFDMHGRLFERFVLVEAGRPTREESRAVLAVPRRADAGVEDAVRGVVAVSVMHDHRAGTSTVRTPNGETVQVPLPADAPGAAAAAPSWLTRAGWIGAALIAMILLVLKFRARARAV